MHWVALCARARCRQLDGLQQLRERAAGGQLAVQRAIAQVEARLGLSGLAGQLHPLDAATAQLPGSAEEAHEW
jgi:hypothetical protein